MSPGYGKGMAAASGVPGLTLALQVAGDALNPRLPAVGRPGPIPADWVAVGEVSPPKTFTHPIHIQQQWMHDLNIVTPSQIAPTCPAVWAWRCDNGHVWVQSLAERALIPGCPRCDHTALPRSDRHAGGRVHGNRRLSVQQAIGLVPDSPNFPSHVELHNAVTASEGKTNIRLEWSCRTHWKQPHPTYFRSVSEIIFYQRGCPVCWKREHYAPPSGVAPGDAFYSFVEQAGSTSETQLRRALMRLLPIDGTVNAVCISDDFFGKPMVHPDILCPTMKVAIEYDGTAADKHLTAEGRARDRTKDALLHDVGWRVVRVCPHPVKPIHAHDIVTGAHDSPADIAPRVAEAVRRISPVVTTS